MDLLFHLFFRKCGLIDQYEKQSTSLLVISSNKSTGIVKISRLSSFEFASFFCFLAFYMLQHHETKTSMGSDHSYLTQLGRLK